MSLRAKIISEAFISSFEDCGINARDNTFPAEIDGMWIRLNLSAEWPDFGFLPSAVVLIQPEDPPLS